MKYIAMGALSTVLALMLTACGENASQKPAEPVQEKEVVQTTVTKEEPAATEEHAAAPAEPAEHAASVEEAAGATTEE